MSTITLTEPSATDPLPPRLPSAPEAPGAASAGAAAPPPAACGASSAAGKPIRPGCARPCSACWPPRPCSTCGGLGASGWANSFYSAAVQAGTQSWKALFFGSSDAANFITVDKPPASLWVMELSARIFGAQLVEHPGARRRSRAWPTVGVLYATVRRWFAPGAGLLAGAVLALTPVAALMFRFNNPDALLVLLLVGGAYAWLRALEAGATRWLVLAGALVGLRLPHQDAAGAPGRCPAFALVYLVAGPPTLGRRIWQLVLAAVALLRVGRLVGRHRRAVAGVVRARTSAARRTTACST